MLWISLESLETKIKSFAKDIHDKYVQIPHTTEFAILFLPTEGLYAEVVQRGMIEILQRDYQVNIAGPTTMAALLNSLQMGFKTLAIQKRSEKSGVFSLLLRQNSRLLPMYYKVLKIVFTKRVKIWINW